ncbi:MAG: hypothetical protein U1C74_30965, partial [Phenylobacterium sp.]|nr:hypothetical protein [Phenylobacterium sp.]
MSEGPDIHAAAAQAEDRDAARLEALADLDLAMARRANEAALAAEDDRALCDLAHAYQRASRSLRQTLALKAKLRGERLQEVRRAEIFAPWPGPSRPAAADPDPRRHAALAMAPPDAPSRAP